MSAGFEDYDWMLSTKERPWHGIGTVVQDAPTSDEAIKIARLDWDVVQSPVMTENGVIIPNYYANVRSDTKEVLGMVQDRYKIVQNTEAFSFVDDIIQSHGIECRYETAGSLFNGRKIFLLVRLPDQKIIGDDIENYLFFTNSHDGKSSLTAGITNVRVVCNNTLQLALKNNKRVWKVRHTQSISDKTQVAMESLGLAVKYVDSTRKMAEKLASTSVDERVFFKNLFKDEYFAKASRSAKELMIERIYTIYSEKDDLCDFKGTAWGMYNAVADYCSNCEPLRTTKNYQEKKLSKALDEGDRLLVTAQDVLMCA